MNERYLFRGKRLNGEGWLTGNIYHLESSIFVFPPKSFDSFDRYEVDPATIGQCTGLRDKNGKTIFEGDILDCGDRIVHVMWNTPNGCWDSWFVRYINKLNSNGITAVEWKWRATVIGNIYDNPEFLEHEED